MSLIDQHQNIPFLEKNENHQTMERLRIPVRLAKVARMHGKRNESILCRTRIRLQVPILVLGRNTIGDRTFLHTTSISRQTEKFDENSKTKPEIPESANRGDQARRKSAIDQIRDVLHRKRIDLEPRIKEQLESLGKRWNAYSGYEEVLEAKAQVLEAEMELKQLREEQSELRKDYMKAVGRRAGSQQTVNKLLQRREDWSDADLNAYMELVKSEHVEARSEKEATERYESIGHRVNAAWDDVVRKTLERYHQEQIWSDRVRAGSTYGSMIIAGLNVAIFILAFLVVEPYKRKKLAQTFESRLLEGEAHNAEMLAGVVKNFTHHLTTLEERGNDTNESLKTLLAKAGVSLAEVEASEEGGQKSDSTQSSQPTIVGQSPQTTNQKRRDLGMAGAVGFAVGAGLLAAFGALQS